MSTTILKTATDLINRGEISELTISSGGESATITRESIHKNGAKTKTAKVVAIPSDETFNSEEYIPAPELREIADMLRERHNMPTEITVQCVWKKRGGTHCRKMKLAFCWKTSGLGRFFSGYDFVIWVAADHLREWKPTAEQLEALLAHELNHAGIDPETLKPIALGHDFEGFRFDIEKYGTWNNDLASIAQTFEQIGLFS